MCAAVIVRLIKSVARIRLAKTENPSACVTVTCKVCRSAITMQFPAVVSGVYKLSINPRPVL
jgi:RNase P subunit RPR2